MSRHATRAWDAESRVDTRHTYNAYERTRLRSQRCVEHTAAMIA